MRILITGGAGYVGTVLTKRLLDYPEIEEILIYDNLSRRNYNVFLGNRFPNAEKIKFVYGDILDLRKLKKMLEKVDVVYHLAARVSTPFANLEADFHEQVNHWGTAELVAAVEGSKVEKFIYSSSTSVYGASEGFIHEDTPPDPKTFYGVSKLRGEEHVRRLLKKRQAYILRCGNVYGFSRSMRFDAVINKFMFDANYNGRIQIHGNGKQYRAFVHVKVLAELLAKLLFNPTPSGVYNVVDRNLQVLDVVDELKEIYPALEFNFVNQHLQLRQMKVSPESHLRDYVDFFNTRSLKDELVDFKGRFSF